MSAKQRSKEYNKNSLTHKTGHEVIVVLNNRRNSNIVTQSLFPDMFLSSVFNVFAFMCLIGFDYDLLDGMLLNAQ